jgi:hypothetical protein
VSLAGVLLGLGLLVWLAYRGLERAAAGAVSGLLAAAFPVAFARELDAVVVAAMPAVTMVRD